MARKVWHDHGMRTQVTFDCADPHAQVAFWAAVFGSQVEDHSELVDQLVAAGRLPAADMITIAPGSARTAARPPRRGPRCRSNSRTPARHQREFRAGQLRPRAVRGDLRTSAFPPPGRS